MENIRIERAQNDIRNGWNVIADTKRFGKDAILFEGRYDECWKYLDRLFNDPECEKYKVIVTGLYDGEYIQHYFDHDWYVIHRNGFVEQDRSKFGM